MLVFTFIHQGVLRAGRHLCVSDKPGALLAWKAVGAPSAFWQGLVLSQKRFSGRNGRKKDVTSPVVTVSCAGPFPKCT